MTAEAVGAGPGAREALEEALVEAAARGVSIRDHGPRGIWVTGEDVGAIAVAWARRLGAPVRRYTARATARGSDVELELVAEVVGEDGARRPLRAVEDRFTEEGDPDVPLADVARAALEVALESHEQLHHEDAAISRWG